MNNVLMNAPVFLLLFIRSFTMLLTLPLFSMRAVSRVAKVALAGYMAFFLLGTVDFSSYNSFIREDGIFSLNYLFIAIGEGLIGVIIGFYNYDATRRIMIRKSEIQIFNEKLQFAKTKFDEWVVKKTQGGDADLSEIVQKAFEVDKAGQINKSFLFKLLRYSIKDPEFKKAQELLRESIETAGTKTYILFQIKNEKNGWDNLSIDFQSL